ncbi:hypothetical protein AMTRI_Chr01g102350 [Amborella trichopoda]|uniref:NAC domain-containing protein n=1 Tax=Amborella trichopoda TaxID=13333 RepID=W1NQ04_AMBTC|nr:NAC transcription factor 32 [Amborella trichopoda]ERM97185.1 hypothetical protein AMTR_s00119p00026870 [Amborella trichopoda]|eukprot:XP_006829769.1 NAC transcription factor 32 [Amborella trichopoda]
MAGVAGRNATTELNLPPGFRFFPTDEELVLHYLCKKITHLPLPVPIIAEVDLYKYDPWQLPEKALFGDKEWYFFTPRDRKYPNGSRPNRAAGTGYWKATGADKLLRPQTSSNRQCVLGIKKALVFYEGKAPKGQKTNWIMHEYRLANRPSTPTTNYKKGTSLRLDEWVLCRLYNKKNNYKKMLEQTEEESLAETMDSLEAIDEKQLPLRDSFTNADSHIFRCDIVGESLPDMVDLSPQPAFGFGGEATARVMMKPPPPPSTGGGERGIVDWVSPFLGFDDLQYTFPPLGEITNTNSTNNDYYFSAYYPKDLILI